MRIIVIYQKNQQVVNMKKFKAQSFLEYAVLIVIVAISISIMGIYVRRSINARVSHIWADLYHPQIGLR